MHVFFIDASWVQGDAGIAAIAIDSSIDSWFVKAHKIQAQSTLEAELRAIFLALNWAVEFGWQEVHILLDSKIAVQSLNARKGAPDWKVSSLFYSIVNVIKVLPVVRFFFMNRSFNTLADGVAKNARIASELAVLYQGKGNPPVISIDFLNQ
uniref:RNase H type-1 domain-containing protein n=1 Tax=Cannabis sativa TaxID=3483 RepID=A0A803NMY4_CANSA